jgi:septal ring factor EnvC (AmiA/AmiB activator)
MNWTAVKGTLQCIALIAVSYLSVTAAIAVHTFEKHASAVLMNVSDSVKGMNKVLDTVNGKGGTLQQVDLALTDVRRIISHTDRELTAEETAINKTNAQVSSTMKSLNTAISGATNDMQVVSSQASVTMIATQNSLIQLQRDEVSANTAIVQFTKQMDTLQPVVLSTLNNTNATMENVKETTTEIRNKVHDELHPTKKKMTFWGFLGAGAIGFRKYAPIPPIF